MEVEFDESLQVIQVEKKNNLLASLPQAGSIKRRRTYNENHVITDSDSGDQPPTFDQGDVVSQRASEHSLLGQPRASMRNPSILLPRMNRIQSIPSESDHEAFNFNFSQDNIQPQLNKDVLFAIEMYPNVEVGVIQELYEQNNDRDKLIQAIEKKVNDEKVKIENEKDLALAQRLQQQEVVHVNIEDAQNQQNDLHLAQQLQEQELIVAKSKFVDIEKRDFEIAMQIQNQEMQFLQQIPKLSQDTLIAKKFQDEEISNFRREERLQQRKEERRKLESLERLQNQILEGGRDAPQVEEQLQLPQQQERRKNAFLSLLKSCCCASKKSEAKPNQRKPQQI